MSRQKKNTFFGVLVLLSCIVGATLIIRETTYQKALQAPSFTEEAKTVKEFTIKKGQSLKEIAHALLESHLINNEDAFIRYVQEQGKSGALQAGNFTLPNHITLVEVVDYLVGAKLPEQVRVTIPEGTTVEGIANLFESKGFGSKDEFLSCVNTCTFSEEITHFLPKKSSQAFNRMEGYLFPDTYFFPTTGVTPQKFLSVLLTTFKRKVVDVFSDELKDSGHTLSDIIIMASIVERETTPRDDQSMVAGILWKRIREGVQLAADATTVYMKQSKEPLTYQDLRSKNPYNTRIAKGLPPSPISNPGLKAIQAALSPSESDFWYYLHDSNGVIHFARTEREHDQNKRLYLQ